MHSHTLFLSLFVLASVAVCCTLGAPAENVRATRTKRAIAANPMRTLYSRHGRSSAPAAPLGGDPHLSDISTAELMRLYELLALMKTGEKRIYELTPSERKLFRDLLEDYYSL